MRGGFRSPSKARITSCDGVETVEGTRSSEIDRKLGGSEVITVHNGMSSRFKYARSNEKKIDRGNTMRRSTFKHAKPA